jgi:RNA-binding protein YlmH
LDKSKVLEKYTDYEDRLLANKILDIVYYCGKSFSYKATFFMDPRQQKLAEDILKSQKTVAYYTTGGFSSSERKQFVIYHEDYNFDDIQKPYEIIEFSWYSKNARKPSHRDL